MSDVPDEGDSCGVRYLAILDILGFRQLIGNQTITNVGLLLKQLEETLALIGHNPQTPQANPASVEFVLYSDSVLLYTEKTGVRGLMSVIRATTETVGHALTAGLPLRGAITKGELFVSGNRNLFAGEGLIRGYELEQAQNWAGAILDDGRIGDTDDEEFAIDSAIAANLLRTFPVPWKEEPSPREKLTVVWPSVLGGPGATEDAYWERMEEVLGSPSESARSKHESTLDLWRDYRENRANAEEREPARQRTVERYKERGEWEDSASRSVSVVPPTPHAQPHPEPPISTAYDRPAQPPGLHRRTPHRRGLLGVPTRSPMGPGRIHLPRLR